MILFDVVSAVPCDKTQNSNCDKTQLNLSQNSKTQTVTKLKKLNCDSSNSHSSDSSSSESSNILSFGGVYLNTTMMDPKRIKSKFTVVWLQHNVISECPSPPPRPRPSSHLKNQRRPVLSMGMKHHGCPI